MTIDTSSDTLPVSLAFFKVDNTFSGFLVKPIQFPLNMILVFYLISSILDFRLNYSQSILDKRLLIC